MMIHAPTAYTGLLNLRHERLKLYVSTGGADAPRLDLDLLRTSLRGVTVDLGQNNPAGGFALLSAQPGMAWRFAGYLWRADGLARLVLWLDRAGGTPGRVPDAAFHVGGFAEVALIAAEWERWRRACTRGDVLNRYLADVDQ